MATEEKITRSPLEKPLHLLTEEDISQLTREDCRRYLKQKGMRRPSWNKSQAIQQVISLKRLLETTPDSDAGVRKKQYATPRPHNPPPPSPSVAKSTGGDAAVGEPAAEEPVPRRGKDLDRAADPVPTRFPVLIQELWMADHVVLSVDHVNKPDFSQSLQEGSCSHAAETLNSVIDIHDVDKFGGVDDEEKPLLEIVECRICQEEDSLQNMETPCACSGSLKFAHRKCVQRWCNEKGDTTCEICHQPYQPGYTAPPPPLSSEDAVIDISGWRIHGPPMDLHDPRLLAMAAAERHLLEADYDEYSDPNASGAAFCRSAALILMALLLLRHALTIGNGDDDDEASTFFSLFLLRAAGFLLPCYIMAWAISILQRRRQAQEAAAALAATEVAFMIHAGQRRGVHFTVTPRSTVTPEAVAAPPQEQPAQ